MGLKSVGGYSRDEDATAAWEPDGLWEIYSLAIEDVLAALSTRWPATKCLNSEGDGQMENGKKEVAKKTSPGRFDATCGCKHAVAAMDSHTEGFMPSHNPYAQDLRESSQ